MLPRKSREMASKKKGEMYETKLEVQKAKTYEKKVRVQKGKIIDEETISVTASVTNSGQSKEGMKGLIFGLNKEKWLLLEQNKYLQKKVGELELEKMARRGVEKVKARTLKDHMKAKSFECTAEGCGKAFALRKDQVKHISQVHHKERKYICGEDNCSKKFGNKSNLARHRREVHLIERFIQFNDCKKEFLRKDHLKAHIKIVHQNIRPHCCKEGECCKAFARSGQACEKSSPQGEELRLREGGMWERFWNQI